MEQDKACVDIVLPVYNGEKYLSQQLDSIIKQIYTNWRIYIRDDKSTDGTVDIIESYQRKYPEKIVVVIDEERNLGVTNNVLHILKYVTSQYVMLCDQDDIWFRNKIGCLLRCMYIKERKLENIPLLIYSDAVIVDEDMQVISPSFHDYSNLNCKRRSFVNLLQANIFQGASCIMNRLLIDKINSVEIRKLNKDIYHDWWIGAIVSAFGYIFCYHRPLMYYRQHGRNVLGADYCPKLLEALKIKDEGIKQNFRKRNYLYINRPLCKELLSYYYDALTDRQREIIEYFIHNSNNMIRFMKLGLFRYYSFYELLLKAFFKTT